MSRLESVRHELLALHRALLAAQRVAHEREHGTLTSGAFLELVIGAPEFAWLRPLTALIVGIDEALDDLNPDSARARRLALIAAKKAALTGGGASSGPKATATPSKSAAMPSKSAATPSELASTPQKSAATPGAGGERDDGEGDPAASTEALLLTDTRKLLTPDPQAGEFQRQYAAALHDAPEIVIAHASVLRALAQPAALPAQE